MAPPTLISDTVPYCHCANSSFRRLHLVFRFLVYFVNRNKERIVKVQVLGIAGAIAMQDGACLKILLAHRHRPLAEAVNIADTFVKVH